MNTGKSNRSKGSRPAEQLFAVAETGAGNQFRRAAKLDEITLLRVAFFFCNGVGVRPVAAATGLSAKTVRSLYLQLRDRLSAPKFNRWHAAYQRLAALPEIEMEGLVRSAFIDVLADCALNETCRRNYRLGNRKRRLCRACPLPARFRDQARTTEALDVIDAVHAFYERLGIRDERGMDALVLFRLRLIHTTTIATALGASKRRSDGLAYPADRSFLSVATLLDVLLTNLAERPL